MKHWGGKTHFESLPAAKLANQNVYNCHSEHVVNLGVCLAPDSLTSSVKDFRCACLKSTTLCIFYKNGKKLFDLLLVYNFFRWLFCDNVDQSRAIENSESMSLDNFGQIS